MAKYHELLKTHADDITEIKSLKAQYNELVERANEKWGEVNPNSDKPNWEAMDKADEVYGQASKVYEEYLLACEKLHQDIIAAYWDVPYTKPRKQGIKRFYELADIP